MTRRSFGRARCRSSLPPSPIDGRIISVVGGVTQIGQYQVVVLNRGTRDGLSVGDVLTVFQTGETIKDRFGGGKVRLPDEEAVRAHPARA